MPTDARTKIPYNSQRDNYGFKTLGAWSQCFSTSSCMFLSYYIPEPTNDAFVKAFIERIDLAINPKADLGAKIKQAYSWITKDMTLWWLSQKVAIESYLAKHNISPTLTFRESDGTFEELIAALKKGPVIVGTNKLGGLPNGHIILLVDYEDKTKCFIAKDPFGNAYSGYKDTNGDNVCYPVEWFKNYTLNVTGKGTGPQGRIRYMFKA